jgi:hypothetical protein
MPGKLPAVKQRLSQRMLGPTLGVAALSCHCHTCAVRGLLLLLLLLWQLAAGLLAASHAGLLACWQPAPVLLWSPGVAALQQPHPHQLCWHHTTCTTPPAASRCNDPTAAHIAAFTQGCSHSCTYCCSHSCTYCCNSCLGAQGDGSSPLLPGQQPADVRRCPPCRWPH